MEIRRGPQIEHRDPNRIEITHLGNYDIVTNPSLSVEFKQEIEPITAFLESQDPERNLFTYPDRDSPKYFIKKRRNADAVDIEIIREHQYSAEGIYRSDKPTMYAFNSISHEMRISQRIADIIHSDEAQFIVQKHGLKQIKFVEPHAGIISRPTRQKYMVYNYIPGEPHLQKEGGKDTRWDTMVDELKNLFKSNGIQAQDFGDEQFITDKDDPGIVHLIDVEGYLLNNNE